MSDMIDIIKYVNSYIATRLRRLGFSRDKLVVLYTMTVSFICLLGLMGLSLWNSHH
jgi:hypothetical protein